MITVDINMPDNCFECPFSSMIMSGDLEGTYQCHAMAARLEKYDLQKCLIHEYDGKRPKNCPIVS